jgi:hypothetical protein
MPETKIGYRGSKSTMNNLVVKEQRVDGNLCQTFVPHLRYTLKGFARNYQVRILSNLVSFWLLFSSLRSVGGSLRSVGATKTHQLPDPVGISTTEKPPLLSRTSTFHPYWLTGFTLKF